MKHTLTNLALLGLFVSFSCSNLNTPDNNNEPGNASITVNVGKVGMLGKIRNIELNKLYISLTTTGETTIYDTIPLNGNSGATIIRTYSNLASLLKTWTLSAETRDVDGVTIHSGTTDFIVPARSTIDVSLNLDSKYSMLKANFFPIRDSVTRCELLVDGNKEDDSSFSKQALLGDTIRLSYNYLRTGVSTRVMLDVYGTMWGFDTLLYTGDTLITPVPGINASYNVTLRWVGPALPPPGSATMNVVLGAVGTTIINGTLEPKILFQDDFNDGILDLLKWRLSCTHGPVYGGIQTSIGDIVHEEDSVLKIIQASTDWGGRVYSKTFKVDTLSDLVITFRTKTHFANTYLKAAGLMLCAIDSAMDTIVDRPVSLMHVNYSYVPGGGPYEGFGQVGINLLPPIWDEWVDEKLVYSPSTGELHYTLNGTTVTLTGYPLHSAFVKLDMLSNGWFTGHYIHFDYISIEQ
jgi:hypothetical protein